MEKMPPIEKIYEAYSAIADGRVAMGQGSAAVRSSNSVKTYAVRWEGDHYRSSDSATYWQGYAGYPVIAALMLEGRLPLDKPVASLFAGVDWTALNQKHKRDYTAAAGEVKAALAEQGADIPAVEAAAQEAYAALQGLPITLGRARAK